MYIHRHMQTFRERERERGRGESFVCHSCPDCLHILLACTLYNVCESHSGWLTKDSWEHSDWTWTWCICNFYSAVYKLSWACPLNWCFQTHLQHSNTRTIANPKLVTPSKHSQITKCWNRNNYHYAIYKLRERVKSKWYRIARIFRWRLLFAFFTVDFFPRKINPRINVIVRDHAYMSPVGNYRVPRKFDPRIVSVIHL